jgi:protein O-GlcNAc transferase
MHSSHDRAERLKQDGNACKAAGDLPAAVACYRRSLEIAPDYVPSLYNLALCMRELDAMDEAESLLRRILELDPEDGDVLLHLGTMLHDQSRLAEAETVLRMALRQHGKNPLLWLNLGMVLARQYVLDEAAACLRNASELDPGLADADFLLGNVHGLLGKHDEALRCYQRARSADPANRTYLSALISQKHRICDWAGIESLYDDLLRSMADRRSAPVQPFSLLSLPTTRSVQLSCAREFAEDLAAKVARHRPRPASGHRAGMGGGRIRVGYLSGDFHEHATAYLAAELFELHERSRFEICAYSYGPDRPSAMRSRLRESFDRFRDLSGLSDFEAADAIRADGVDILVDLKGYTVYGRPQISAMRLAPVQVNFLGYPGTMGAEAIDYIIGDRFVTPSEHGGDYSEKLVLMPGTYQVNDRKRTVGETPSRRDLGLPESSFVFCCFNQPYKVLPETFAAWLRLLRELPDSVLWMLEGNAWAAENLRRHALVQGIDSRRMIFAPILPLDRHLGRLRAADLFLDTYPYNAHTSASDALWAGLPVLTRAGDTFASRVAGSLLAALGLPELIAGSAAEYEATALRLARDPAELAALRERIARNRTTAAVFDTPRFARNLESAYELMWRNYLAGNKPRQIEITEKPRRV